jgi:glutaredoxin
MRRAKGAHLLSQSAANAGDSQAHHRSCDFQTGHYHFVSTFTNMSETNTSPKITAYLKTFCGWSEGIRAIMRKYELPYEEKDIIKNPAFRWEMEQRSGQSLSPCVEIDGHMLPDISGEEVEKWMLDNGYLQKNDAAPDAPIDSACTDEQHAEMALGRTPVPGKIRFFD